jgi:hypothetical protein
MKNETIYNKWTELINDIKYKEYFQSIDELWDESFKQLKLYINTNKKRPSGRNNELAIWCSCQMTNYRQKKNSMKNKEKYNKWDDFINNIKYKKYFQSNDELWDESFKQLKLYIDTNEKRPSKHDKDNKILGNWVSAQQTNYNKKMKIMKNKIIYNKWEDFINDSKYKKYFLKD